MFDLIESVLSNREMKIDLNALAHRYFHTNAGVLIGSIIFKTLFLMLINDLPDAFSTQLGVCADHTTIHCFLNSKFVRSAKVNLEVALEKDLQP